MREIKVLHLFNQYLPQTENWAFHLIQNTPDVEVFIGAKEYLKNNFYHSGFTFISHPFGALIVYWNNIKRKRLLGILKKAFLKMIRPILFGWLKDYIYQFAKNHQIDIVHVHFADMAWFYLEVPRRLQVPLVVSFYGWDYEQLPNLFPIYKKRIQRLFQEADLFLCEGEHGCNILKMKGCPVHKIKIQKLGVPIEKIPFYKRNKKREELHLVQVASFTEKKGHIYTLKAFERSLEKCPNLRLTLIGGENQPGLRKEILNQIELSGLSNKIVVKKSVDHSILYEFLENHHVFIHPSCYAADGDCEGGAPIVLLNAQATGMPVISTNHCDIPMEVLHKETGFLSEEKDIEALALNIQKFYEMSEDQYHRFCNKARKHVLSNFNAKENAVELRRRYAELVG